MPPQPGQSGYVFVSWRAALEDAQKGIDAAYDRRRRTFQAAYDSGLTLRSIAETVGLTRAGVHKIIGVQNQRDQTKALDGFAGMVLPPAQSECDGSGGFGPSKDSGLIGWSVCPGCSKCQSVASPKSRQGSSTP